jgi:hypothetical protein
MKIERKLEKLKFLSSELGYELESLDDSSLVISKGSFMPC